MCARFVALREGNAERVTRPHGGDGGPGARDRVAQEIAAIGRDRLQQRVRDDQLVVHDVAQPPPPPGPRVGEVGLGPVFDEPLGAAGELARLDAHGRGHPRGRHFREEAGDVLPVPRRARPPGPVAVVLIGVDDAALALLLQAERHGGPDEVHLAPDQRMDVGIDGVGVGRGEDAGAGRAHLVLVQPDLGKPLVVDRARQGLRLLLREHEPVAVVVVPDVVVVDPGHPRALVGGAEVLPIPLRLHDLAVGIERGDEQDHHLVQPAPRLRVGRGGERVGPFHRHLRGADLRRVDVAGDEDDRASFLDQAGHFRFRHPARVGDAARDLLQAIQVLEIGLGRDDRHQHVFAARRPAEGLDGDAGRRGIESAKIRSDLAIVGQRPVRADGEAEELGRRGDVGRARGARTQRDQRGEQDGRRDPSSGAHELSGWPPDQRSVMVRTIQPERTPSTMQRADITPGAFVV